MRTNKTNTIGVIVPRISRHFFSTVISGIEETAFNAGYDVIICQSLENLEREKKLIKTMLSNRVDGVLISISMETINFDHLQDYKAHDFPLIFFDRQCSIPDSSNVIIDDFKASFEVTEHLIQQGCQSIVHLSGPHELEIYKQRTGGYLAALEKYGIKIRKDYILESNLMQEDGVEAAKKILQLPNVDGVFSANDVAAISTMQYLKNNNIQIPEDIAFAGFSNEPISAVIEPPLTTVNQHDFEMGTVATEMLLEQIRNKTGNTVNQTKILATDLIIRKSSNG